MAVSPACCKIARPLDQAKVARITDRDTLDAELFERAPNKKDVPVIEGAGHYEMYEQDEYVDQAVERLDPFYRQYLGPA